MSRGSASSCVALRGGLEGDEDRGGVGRPFMMILSCGGGSGPHLTIVGTHISNQEWGGESRSGPRFSANPTTYPPLLTQISWSRMHDGQNEALTESDACRKSACCMNIRLLDVRYRMR